jgi:iron-sulfur cluster repair protein YtfE (RIC family)
MTGLADVNMERHFAQHEHRDLAFGRGRLRETIEQSDSFSGGELGAYLRRILVWLHSELEPHAAWEDAWLFPRIDDLTRTPWATHAMRYEHHHIGALISILERDAERLNERVTRRLTTEVVAHLVALSAVLDVHIAYEEQGLLPLLDGPAKAA